MKREDVKREASPLAKAISPAGLLHASRSHVRAFHRAGRLHWATLAFLLGFTALIVVVGYFYLAPGVEALADEGTDDQKRQKLKAYSSLLMLVLLVLLFLLMLIVFRVRRFFVDEQPRTKTEYPDAWAESAKRVRVEDDEQ